jgi:hypothetical protein
MTRRITITGSMGAVLFLVVAPLVAQTTTGRLIGTVVDDAGEFLSGVSVTVTSPSLIGGAQSKSTDDAGTFSFIGIAPGEYTVRAEQSGFVPQERTRVKVSLGHTVSLTIAMPQGSFSGEIEVVDETPVVDPTQVGSGQVFDGSYMQDSAIGSVNRTYYSIVTQTAGVAGGGAWGGIPQPRVFGSTIGENAYFIDGMDITDPSRATTGVTLNFDAIDEIQLQTGGFEAEYGRATGGIINLVTRSGGNRFSGTIDVRYRDESFQESGDRFDTAELDTSFEQYSFTLGGPILRDRLWFFTSYEWTSDAFTPIDSPTTRELERQDWLAKVTWQIDDSWRMTGKYSGHPAGTDNFDASRQRQPTATVFVSDETEVVSGELSGVLSDWLLWHTTVGAYRYYNEAYPQSGDLQTIGHYNYDLDRYTDNYGSQQYWGSNRDDLSTDLTWFVDDLAGSHELKGGMEYSRLWLPDDGLCSTGTPNGERCVAGIPGFFFYDVYVSESDVTMPWFMAESYSWTKAEYTGALSTAFVQDAWRVTRNLTLKPGLRYDSVSYDNNDGVEVADMAMLQPRVGLAWDLTGDAKTLLRGSWGRFMHPNALSLPTYATTLETSRSRWWSCSAAVTYYTQIPVSSPEACAALAASRGWDYGADNEGWDPYGWTLPPSQIFGSEPGAIDPDLRATYADELILAFERAVGTRSSIELAWVDKKTRDVFDDTCNGNVPTPSVGAECTSFVVANLTELRRDYRAFIVSYQTRGLDWLTLLASYTWSTSEGSVEYTQNAGVIVDHYPWNFDNIYGYLSDHRTHRVKLNGFFTPGGDWTVAFDGFLSSPFTWAPYEDPGNNEEIPAGFHFLEPRGSREANSSYQLDLQLSKGFTVGPVRIVLIGSVYNVFSNERPTAVCTHDGGCGAFEMGEPTDWQTPRRYELGFRVEF